MNPKDFEECVQRLERSGFPIDKRFAKAIRKMKQDLADLAKEVSLCVDEYGVAQSTHYINSRSGEPKIEPKGSFIELCSKARDIMKKLGEE